MAIIAVISENNMIYSNYSISEFLVYSEILRTIENSSEFIIDRTDFSLLLDKIDSDLYLVMLHKNSDEGNLFPFLNGWREISRELCWTQEELGFNFSVIRYDKKETNLLISVVLSTCNQSEWLEKVLWGYEAQLTKGFELIIADDGSDKETYLMLQRMIPQLSFLIKHVWQEDRGFRKCNILNKGVLASQTGYLLFSDGDCIPRNDFVSTHLKYREKGRFLSGGYHKLNLNLSKKINREDILAGNCFDVKWLKDRGMSSSFKNNKFTSKGFKGWLLNSFTTTKATWNGHNSSAWLSDLLLVNGFDERMQYGGEDREFGERLENINVHGKQIRYSSVCIHLDHSRGYKTQESIQKNLIIRKNTRNRKIKYTSYGIFKHL